MTREYFFKVKVLFLWEGEAWVAQGLEYDITAQGKTIAETKLKFEQTFVGQILLDIKHGRQPLEGFHQAPQLYWAMFEKAERLADRKPFYLPKCFPPAFMIRAEADDLRISA